MAVCENMPPYVFYRETIGNGHLNKTGGYYERYTH